MQIFHEILAELPEKNSIGGSKSLSVQSHSALVESHLHPEETSIAIFLKFLISMEVYEMSQFFP